jgi:predicted NBD/HSP70 family sugar kinase
VRNGTCNGDGGESTSALLIHRGTFRYNRVTMFVHSRNKLIAEPPLAATGQRMREHNEAVLLRLVWSAPEGISRADLARRSGLSRSTVSGITGDLLDGGLIVEDQVAPSSGGRPPILLRFCDDRFAVVGVEIGGSHVSCVRTDLRGEVEQFWSEPYDVSEDPQGTLDLVFALVDRALAELAGDRRKVGIGVAVPSPLNSFVPGLLSDRIFPSWAGVELGEVLHDRYELPILMDNDANLGALAEAWWGAGRGVPHFTYVKVATGVGAGHILNGEIFRGASGTAGEIGHTAVAPSGRRCRCGLSGCLEAEVGSHAIVERTRERLARAPSGALVGVEPLTLPAVVAAARGGDALAAGVIADAGRQLGIALANLVNLLNPSKVILGGQVTMASDLLLPPLRRAMAERALASNVAGAEVRVSDLPHAVARGAATLVLKWALDHAEVLTTREPAPPPRASTRLLPRAPTDGQPASKPMFR